MLADGGIRGANYLARNGRWANSGTCTKPDFWMLKLEDCQTLLQIEVENLIRDRQIFIEPRVI